jgi:hypothetical protein
MKKPVVFLSILMGLSLLFTACSDENKDPVLDMSLTQKPVISTPANGSELVLLEAQNTNSLDIIWSPTIYNLDNLPATKYILQMDTSATFPKPHTLVSSEDVSFSISYGALNNILLTILGLQPDVPHDIYFRVNSFIVDNTGAESTYSDVVKVSITPYSAAIHIKPIYLLGSATEAGWDNTKALEMSWIGEGKFAIVANLTAGTDMYIKFISRLGAWAPQWGTDASGTWQSGPLVYRPDETVADPPAIPAPDVSGVYRIVADTVGLEYTVTPASPQLYILGDGTPAGWDNANAIPMPQLSPGIFEISIELGGEGKFLKFIEVLGQWAPQYGTDETGTSSGGPLVLRPTESEPDPPAIPCPPTAGTYTVKVDLATMQYTIK